MSKDILSIVVVGHTNAGKTSLLRTLTRNKYFGEVSPRNATTKHVEQTSVTIAGKPVLRLFDTPGFEDSIEFRHYLRQFDDGRARKDILNDFLNSPEAKGRFEQQAKVVRVLLTMIDAIFYVIDSTEKPLPKYISELDVLSMCARPVLPILNFVQDDSSFAHEWSQILADRGLHIKVSFDAVAPMMGSERQLYTRLGSLLEANDARLMSIADAIEREAEERRHASLLAIAELLTDVTSYRKSVPEKDAEKIVSVTDLMREHVRSAEVICVDALLAIFRFDRTDLADIDIPVIGTHSDDDLFNPEAIKKTAVRLGLGAIIGTLVGLGIDIALVGVTFGAGTIVGGALSGAMVTKAKDIWRWGKAKIRRLVDLVIDEPTLSNLLVRQLQLLILLNMRTHASQVPLNRYTDIQIDKCWKDLAAPLNKVRIHPTWSRLEGDKFVPEEDRQKAIDHIQKILLSSNILSDQREVDLTQN